MNTLNREAVKKIREILAEDLSILAESLDDFDIQVQSGSFTDTSVTFKVEVSLISEDGVVQDRVASDFARYAQQYGLKADDLNAEIILHDGKKGKIVGLKTRNRKYPVIAEASDGRRYKLSADQARRYLGREPLATFRFGS